MKKILMILISFISTFTLSKEIKFKLFHRETGKTYIITDKEYTEIPIEYDNNKFIPFKFKIIDKGLSYDTYIFEIKYDNKKYKLNGIKEIEHRPLNKTGYQFYSKKDGFIRFSSNKKVYFDFLNTNNNVQLLPAIIDTNVDLLKSSISDFDNRKANKVKLNDKFNLWSRYSVEHHKDKVPGFFTTIFINNVGLQYRKKSSIKGFTKKTSIIQTLNIGIDRIYKNSLIGAFLTFGIENSEGYRVSKFGEGNKLEIIKNKKNGFHVSDTTATMFGAGLSHSNSFSNGIYYDTLAQFSGFVRNMTSKDGQFANSTAFATSLSFEAGFNKKFITNMVSITPQIQQVYHYYHQNKFTDSLDITMPKIEKHIFNTRFGIKVEHKKFYEKLNVYLDYNKALNDVSVEGEIGFDEKLTDKVNIHSSLSYQQEVYTKNKKIKSTLGIIY